MPIYDQGYRRYRGLRAPRVRAWAVIARTGARTLLRRRLFVSLLVLAWSPFFVRAVQLYAAANLPQASFLAPTPAMFRRFLDSQDIFVFFVAVYAGAGLIANDRRANALQIYLSKPLTRTGYVFGKLSILMLFLLLVSWVPSMLLLAVQVLFAGNFTFVIENLYLLPVITVFSLVQACTASIVILALSSLSKNSRFVGILYAALVFMTRAVFNTLWAITSDSSWSWIGFTTNLAQIGDAIFGLPTRYATPVPVAGAALVVVLVLSVVVLARRVRGVEVVS